MPISPVPVVESRSEVAVVGLGLVSIVLFFAIDLVTGAHLLDRYWPVVGVLWGLGMLAVHRFVAPDEW